MPSLSFVITTHNRPAEAANCIESILRQTIEDYEIIIVTSPAGNATAFLRSEYDDPRVTVIEESARRGPAAAGNVAFRHTSGDIIVSLDDDAELAYDDAAERILAEFESNPELGILAFRIESYDTGETLPHEIPVGPDGHLPNQRHSTTYFVGAGAALRATAVENARGYPEDFFYHMQELDLSLQILSLGYGAIYEPSIVVRHKRSEPGRPDDLDRWRLILENRIRVAVRHLPLRYILSSLLIWTPYVLYKTRGSLPTILSAYLRLLSDIRALWNQREVLDDETLQRIHRCGGRLWY